MTGVDQRAYGLRFRGVPRVPELALCPPDDDPVVTISTTTDPCTGSRLCDLDAERSVRRLTDGRVLSLDRRTSTATFHGPVLEPGLLAHPYLAPVATTFSRWSGREAFHAGAVVVDGRAWAVLGPRTAGKSSLLAALATRGLAVLSDDVLVTDGRVAFAGPRCLDLREPLPGGRTPLARARSDSRWRMALPPVPDRVDLGGWIYLRWGSAVSMRPLTAGDLISRLATGRAGRGLASDPAVLLALATLPSWDLQRPRSWDALEPALDLVCSTVSRTQPRRSPARPVPVGAR